MVIATSVLGSLYALVGDSGLLAVLRMRVRAQQLRYEIAAMEHDNRELLDAIKPLRDAAPDAIEKLAREKLFMARPGDTVYMLPKQLTPPTPAVETEPVSPTGPALLRRR